MNIHRRIADSINDIKARGQEVARLHVELALAELKKKGMEYAGAAAALVVAGLFGFFALALLLAAAAVGLSYVVPLWAALLIVAGILLLIAGILALIAASHIKAVGSPVPEAAVAEARESLTALKDEPAHAVAVVTRSADGGPGGQASTKPFAPIWLTRPARRPEQTRPTVVEIDSDRPVVPKADDTPEENS